jgi:hypothetical protein
MPFRFSTTILHGTRLVCLVVGATLGLCSTEALGDRIILRNFDVLNDVKISGFDEDGVRLESGKTLTWDQIEAGMLAGERQAAFDLMLKELGNPLYRIRQRLSIGDYQGLLSHAEKISGRYEKRTSDAAYWVTLGLMWGRISDGQREAALPAYLRCSEILRVRGDQPPSTPGNRKLVIDPNTGLCPDLAPIWFDKQAAKEQIEPVVGIIAAMPQPRPAAARLYFAALAITAGEFDRAASVLKEPLEGRGEEIRQILLAQQVIQGGTPQAGLASLNGADSGFSFESKPLARYWIGFAKTALDDSAQRRAGLLDLLRLPAVHGEHHPDLAAAGLYRAMQVLDELGDASGSVRVRRELLEQYSQTYHAGLQKKTPQKKTTKRNIEERP